jgi:RNA ligase
MNLTNKDLPVKHPARAIPFDELISLLAQEVGRDHVSIRHDGDLSLYCYTKECVFNRAWNPINRLARGLIIDRAERRVVATPFPKFFNVGESIDTIPDGSFEEYEKVDGSLIIVFEHRGRWRTATKGSLDSAQARWAQTKLDRANTLHLSPGSTYLCEGVYPANRIVVTYDWEGLCLLGAYNEHGDELAYRNLHAIATDIGWKVARRYERNTITDLQEQAKAWPVNEEGRVLFWPQHGVRLKIKGSEYMAVHRLISGCTPLGIWSAMLYGQNLADMRKALPEEFWPDFDKIAGLIGVRLATFLHQIDTAAESVHWDPGVDDRELGISLGERFPGPWSDFVFHRRKGRELLPPLKPTPKNLTPQKMLSFDPVPMIRRSVFNFVRPTGNHLEGYQPSASMNRVQDEIEG